MRRTLLLSALTLLAGACGDGGSSPDDAATDASMQALQADAKVDDAEDAGDADAEIADARAADAELVKLPEGSREVGEVLNLVDTAAADELEKHILDNRLLHPTRRHGLTLSTNLFLRHFPEEHDFLFFFTDHPVPNASAVARFEMVNGAAQPGGGYDFEVRAEGYQSNGRLLGVIAVQHRPKISPPLAHETVHYWANHLDVRFGLGATQAGSVGPHWGYSGVRGQLGGFDASSLRCATPMGAMPPACTPQPDGRVRYLVSSFNAHDNTTAPVSALELYLMGMRPLSSVPATFPVLTQAAEVAGGRDYDAGTVLLEANGITQVAMADIVARHGEKPLRPPAERKLRAAFVVISKQPASDEVMDEVARWSAAFGNRMQHPLLSSFETLSGGAVSMSTVLGARRPTTDQPPPARGPLTCDVFKQDCPRPELTCYLSMGTHCALSRGGAENQPCTHAYECRAGLDCVAGQTPSSAPVCKPYCDATNTASAVACQKLCPGSYSTISSGGKQVGAVCTPP